MTLTVNIAGITPFTLDVVGFASRYLATTPCDEPQRRRMELPVLPSGDYAAGRDLAYAVFQAVADDRVARTTA